MLQKILVAIDRSEMNQQVFDEALLLAKSTESSLMLLHVLYPFDKGYPHPMYPSADAYPSLYDEAIKSYTEQLQQFEHEGVEFLRSLAQKAIDLGIPTEPVQTPGDPGKTLCEIAKSWNADVIMMGRRGRSGLSEILLGSVSNYVLHHAPCSMMIVQGVLSDAEKLQEYLDVC
jgi:nucleotide-binding universal stress UspA family protein